MRRRKRVAVQGVAGCYHDEAARSYFQEDIDILPCDTFGGLIEAVSCGSADAGIMAIENTIAGNLLPNCRLLKDSSLRITGEVKLRISHVLAALPGTDIGDIYEINSHPVAIMQCGKFLSSLPGCRICEWDDTAGSALRIAEKRMYGHAAICGKRAAEIYGLEILAAGIEDDSHNYTRFLVLEREGAGESDVNVSKATLVFSLPHVAGSLSAVLSVFSDYGINLTGIQSLPVTGREWEYLFYVDLVFEDISMYGKALETVKPLINELKILGEYGEGKQII